MRRKEYKGEIGSEFWRCDLTSATYSPKYKNIIYLQSGRTAIDFVIKDIKSFSTPKVALLPSYCCHTMIEPFVTNNVDVIFYDVFIDETGRLKIDVPSDIKCDIVLTMQYFGFSQGKEENIAKLLLPTNAVVIEDATHSIFRKQTVDSDADYIIGSFRKWSGFLTGGFAAKKSEYGFVTNIKPANDVYVQMRKVALIEKKKYLESESESKHFLRTFSHAEEFLEDNYKAYGMDPESLDYLYHLDVEEIRCVRKNNVHLLLEKLVKSRIVTPIFTEVSSVDCPLFLPVIVSGGNRDKLRNHLIQEKIYCPINWPISELHHISLRAQKIYGEELSLICDQRYDTDDMCYIAEKIYEFEDLIWD